MHSEFNQHSEKINTEASEWFALMQSGSVTHNDREKLALWLAESPEHRDAYQQMEIIWNDLAQCLYRKEDKSLKAATEFSFLTQLFSKYRGVVHGLFQLLNTRLRRQMVLVMTSLAIMISFLYISQSTITEPVLYATKMGEVKDITLDDGSRVILGAKSTIRSWSDKNARHVVLESGQVFFDISKDVHRPFLIDVSDIQVQVVGTQFDVRRNKNTIRVAVSEGVVNVLPKMNDTRMSEKKSHLKSTHIKEAMVLTAGQQITKRGDESFQKIKTISEKELKGWRVGRLTYRNANLEDVIIDANRYFAGTIVLGAASLAHMKVTVAVRTDQVAFLPELLSQTLPINVDKTREDKIVISLRH